MLIFNNIKKSYKTLYGEKIIFEGFDLTVHQDDFVSVIGTNGAGKSTLVKLLVGDEYVDEGEVLLKNVPIEGQYPYERKRRIAKVYQNPEKGTGITIS